METVQHVIVGTAGHIDHGKSSLVEALTGTNPDRLEEEKRRGITIDLGFAFLDLGLDSANNRVRLGFVDVPGHERFVRNMLAGVGGIDLVLLVIAADEGIKPQTREHFDICRLLGIPRGIIALTKSDLVDSDALGLMRLEIEEFVRGSFLERAPVVPLSARTGAGIDALKSALLRAIEACPPKNATRHFRLPIDRAFAMKGFGTVVTGTLISGAVRPEDEVEVYPARKRVRVRGLHSGGQPVAAAVAGQRTAVNLAGIEREEIRRGMVLAPPGIFRSADRLDARITLLASARALKNRARVHFHQGTLETVADVVLLGPNELPSGRSALAQLRLDEPALLLPGDRFILRQFSPVVTIGGGTVLDVRAPRHRRQDPAVAAFLETLERANPDDMLAALASAAAHGLTLTDFIARTGWTEPEARATIEKLAQSNRLRILNENPLIVSSPAARKTLPPRSEKPWRIFIARIPCCPESPGRTCAAAPVHGVRSFSVPRSTISSARSRDAVWRPGAARRAGISLSSEETRAKELIEREFERAGLTVPSFAAVLEKLPVESSRARKILQILLREKVLVKVAEDLVFHCTAVAGCASCWPSTDRNVATACR